MNIKEYVKSLFIIYKFNNMRTTLRIMKNNLKLLKGGNWMGYQKIKELISDIDEFHNEAELREILQQILFICEENLKNEPSTNSQIEK